jgi:hypothetical protein
MSEVLPVDGAGDNGEDEVRALKFEENFSRFLAKMDLIPEEYHAALGWLYAYQQIQDQRKRLANRALQMTGGKKVFWGNVLPDELRAPINKTMADAADGIDDFETLAGRNLHKALRHTTWYQEVAIPAARGFGMSETGGTLSGAKLLYTFVSPSRFTTFGQFIRYARLAPENGKAPHRTRGKQIHYNPQAWQALYDLSEVWCKTSPDKCIWRAMWDEWKGYYREKYPDEKTHPKLRIHNMARRKVLREFLRGLWELWGAWEVKYNVNQPQ